MANLLGVVEPVGAVGPVGVADGLSDPVGAGVAKDGGGDVRSGQDL